MNRSYLAAAGVLLVSWVALASPWLSGSVTIPWDAKAHFQAQIQFLAGALHSNDTPFWVPNVFAGSPQIADPQSMMFSPAILLALFDADPSFQIVDAFMFLYLLAGGLAVLMFFRDRGWHPVGGVVAALAFAFGASASSRIQHFGQIHSLAFFAVTLWLLARALDRRSWRWGIASGLSAGLMIAEPDQVGFFAVYLLGGYVLHHWLSSPARLTEFRRSLLPLIAGGVAATLVAAVPLTMTWLFLESSNRPAIPYSEAILGSMHPASLLTTVIADLYGAISPRIEYWGPSSAAWAEPRLFLSQNMGQVYVGALPAVAVIVFGLVSGRLWHRDIRYFTLAGAAMVLYAIGGFTPVYRVFFEHVPGVDLFRRPADATFMIGALLALVGGYVIHRICTDGRERPTWSLWLGLVLFGGAVALAISVAVARKHVSQAELPIATSTAWAIAAVLALALVSRPAIARARYALVVLAAAFMVGDLALNQGPNESTALSPKLYEALRPGTPNETINLIKARVRAGSTPDRRDRVELVGLGFHWPNTGMVHGFDHTLGYNPLRIAEFAAATGAGDGIANPEDRKFTPLFPSYKSMLADMLGLRLIISRVPIEQVDRKLAPGDLRYIGRTKEGFVYENPRALPRILFATNWKSVDFEDLIRTGQWPEFDPHQTVLLEEDPGEFPSGSSRPSNASIGIVQYKNGRIEVSCDSEQAGFLVLNDSFHPWWYATVDGHEMPVLKANVLFRAVRVPAGRHTVVFEFRPFEGAVAELENKLLDAESEGRAGNSPEPLLPTVTPQPAPPQLTPGPLAKAQVR